MKFNKKQQEELIKNPNVIGVSEYHIFYSDEFKEKAIVEYTMGKSARQIFEEAGFKLDEISICNDYASKMLSKWRNKKNNNKMHLSTKKKIKETRTSYQKLQARNEYLEAENEFLKKLHALIQQQQN